MKVRRVTMLLAVALVAIPTIGAAQSVSFFTNQQAFESAAETIGKIQKGVEDFEESLLPPGNIVALDDPLDTFTDNDYFDPGDIEENFRMQSNMGGMNSSVLNPRGVDGLALQAAGFAGTTSANVISNTFTDATDLIFLSSDKTAVGFNTIYFAGSSAGIRVDVYNIANVLIGTTFATGDSAGSNFLGMVTNSGEIIGRVNLWDQSNGAEGVDNVQMWTAVPEPGTFLVLGAGLLLLGALRRRK